MLTLLAFVFALGVLITVHEWGHYRVARAVGVKVLRFSIGFGRPLLRWRRGADGTEFVVAALPLGGYVRMLDEREAPVAPEQRARAFNTQPVAARAAVVAAGPLANLALAVLLFASLALVGTEQPRALLGAPGAASPAAVAGVRGGDLVLGTVDAGRLQPLQAWPDVQLRLLDAASSGGRVALRLREPDGEQRDVTLDFAGAAGRAGDPDFLDAWGLRLQSPPPRIREVGAGSPAAGAGLRPGDLVLQADGVPVPDVEALQQAVRRSAGRRLRLTVRRDAQTLQVQLQAQPQRDAAGHPTWRIGTLLGGEVPMVLVRHGPLGALADGARRTWQLSAMTVRLLGEMVIGRASLHNLSGPLTIADYAGRSAHTGWQAYVGFLAMISISLGVLNLLPLPVLDGGHLLYYAIEALTRRSVPQRWQERLQQGGLAVIALMMAVALYNDFARMLGPFH